MTWRCSSSKRRGRNTGNYTSRLHATNCRETIGAALRLHIVIILSTLLSSARLSATPRRIVLLPTPIPLVPLSAPICSDDLDVEGLGPPDHSPVLKQGDFMYFPRGVIHQVWRVVGEGMRVVGPGEFQ